ncbi:DUF6259 domain-containing protein [Limisphaera sp. VF-2]|uniref:DUF6259 domain-containing protein n=1 Tax=Limisphaera sp. VF-2 TaxID=3400418 RepID=UPI003C1432FB
MRFVLDPQTGAWALVHWESGVGWGSDPGQSRLGLVHLRRPGGLQRATLQRCEVQPDARGLLAVFHPAPEQPRALLRIRIQPLPDLPGFEFVWDADAALEVESLHLFDGLEVGRDSEDACAVVPVREGILVPARGTRAFRHRFDTYAYEGCHMAMLGLVRAGVASFWSWEDPYTCVELRRILSGPDVARPHARLTATLECGPTARRIRWVCAGRGDYVQIARTYQALARQAGWWVPWSEKLRQHPDRQKLFGASNVKLWSLLDRRMNEESTVEQQVRLNWTFAEAARVAEHLKHDLQLDRVLFTLGGWIHRGYDNQHPDILPPAPECGGESAFRAACQRILALGYVLCLHDNYQDMYRDAPSWDEACLNKNPDGSATRGGVWAGGRAYIVCSRSALDLARRPQNLPAVKALSGANAYFIDTTFAAGLYECYDPRHPLRRGDDMRWKQALCDYARSLFGIFGSECGREWGIPHADFFEGLAGVSGTFFHNRNLVPELEAVPVPLFELVYRPCIQVYGKYGFDPGRAADYVLHHLVLGRPLHYHQVPPGLYWQREQVEAAQPEVVAVTFVGPREIEIRYAWTVEKPLQEDWRVFVHFCDDQGRILFQNDHDPVPATSRWKTGRVEQGPFRLRLPEALPPTVSIRMGLYQPGDGRRAWLRGRADDERRIRVGRLILDRSAVQWAPEDERDPRNAADPALFLRADHGWAEGLHPFDRFLKNTHELLSPLNALTADLPMSRHAFLTSDRGVEQVVFGHGSSAVTVVVNRGSRQFAWHSPRFGSVLLPPGGFVVDSDRFVAFHALCWNGLEYAAPPFFTLRSLDGRPLATSRRIRIFHGFGDPRVRIGNHVWTVPREAVLNPSDRPVSRQ